MPKSKKDIRRVLVVYKTSTLNKYVHHRKQSRVAKLFHQKHVATENMELAHQEHEGSLDRVIDTLKACEVTFDLKQLHKMQHSLNYDLVVTVGGDGTFLKTSHYLTHQLILGVNSSPSFSVGALLRSSAVDFSEKMKLLLGGKYTVASIARLEAEINGTSVRDLALNDMLLSNECPAETTRYMMKVGSRIEDQRSSGIWLSTAAGSTAAIHAAGGKVMLPHSQKIQYLVREPYVQKNVKPYQLVNGMISSNQYVEVINKMIHGYLYIDGALSKHKLHFGDTIRFRLAAHPVRVVEF